MKEELPKTRLEAQRKDTVYYYNGHKCTKGHREKRYTGTGICSVCQDRTRAKAKEKKERLGAAYNGNSRARRKEEDLEIKSRNDWLRKKLI